LVFNLRSSVFIGGYAFFINLVRRNRMLGAGEQLPNFSVVATVSLEKGKTFQTITESDYPDKWKVYFFWPKDFTFVCPTEISAFGALDGDFKERNTQLRLESLLHSPDACSPVAG
jgi:hypothetical protein